MDESVDELIAEVDKMTNDEFWEFWEYFKELAPESAERILKKGKAMAAS